MISPARVAAYEILTSITAGSSDLPTAVAFARTKVPDERDCALAAEIAAGVQRWRAALDYLIVAFSKRQVDRLDPEVVEILRLSAYQLLHLTRVPASAVVDDGVNLVKRAGKKSAAGFVNAVLRELSRKRRNLPLPPRPDLLPPSQVSGTEVEAWDGGRREAALDYLSITLSHPRWLAARWLDRLGFEIAEAWMQFNNAPAPLTLRVNRLRTTREALIARLTAEDIRVRAGAFAPDALIVEEGYPLRGATADFVVQDEASQLVALLADPAPGARVLDTCASPGGKTTSMAATLGATGLLAACDVRGRRLDLLRRTLAHAGADRVRLVQADALSALPFSTSFDLVLVDAPCSGLGTLRRDPDIRWRRREEDLPALAEAELTMLQRGADVVAPGGRLIYATCSSEPDENERIADAFLAATRGFAPLGAADAAPRLPAAVVDARGHLKTDPASHGLESFFAAVFERAHGM
jgi:16S rRNA (cytosine967-C5)-methyltransferase